MSGDQKPSESPRPPGKGPGAGFRLAPGSGRPHSLVAQAERIHDAQGRIVWTEEHPEAGIDREIVEHALAFYGLEGAEHVRALVIEAAAWYARQLPYVIAVEADTATLRLRSKGRLGPPLVRMTFHGALLDGAWPPDSLLAPEPLERVGLRLVSAPGAPRRPDFNTLSEAIYECIGHDQRPVPLRPPSSAPVELVWQDGPEQTSQLCCLVMFRGPDQPAISFRHSFSYEALATQPPDVLVGDHPPDPPRAFIGPVLDRRVAFLPATAEAAFEMATNLIEVAGRAADGPRRRNEAVAALAGHYGDREAVQQMRHLGWRHADAYRWLASSGDPEAALRRRQAADAFPPLYALILGQGGAAANLLAATVDDGGSLTSFLRARLGCTHATVQSLSSASADLLPTNAHDLERYAVMLDAIPPDRHPGRSPLPVGVQWRTFQAMARLFPPLLMQRFATASPPPWFASPAVGVGFETRANHLSDCLIAVVRQIILPAVGVRIDDLIAAYQDDRVLEAIVGRRGFGALCDLSDRWTRRIAAIRAASGSGGGLSWPVLSAPFAAGDLQVVPITDRDSLEREGEDLAHCVGIFAGECAEGACHIVSMRRSDGTAISTAAIAAYWDAEPGPIYEVLQHRSRRNAPPPYEASRALASYIEALTSGHLAVDRALHEARRLEIIRARESDPDAPTLEVVGYDHRDLSARARVFEAWKFFLPKDVRDLSYSEWLDRCGFPSVLQPPYSEGDPAE